MREVARDVRVGDVVHAYPETKEIFEQHEMSFCAGCYVTLFSEIEKAAGYAAVKDVEGLISDLKRLVARLERAR